MDTKEFKYTAKNAGIIGLTATMGAVIGFFLQLLVAYYFGAGEATDAFFMAQSTSELLSKLLMGGSVTAIFMPLFIAHLTKGDEPGAWKLGLNVVNIMAVIYLLLVLAIYFFTEPFVRFIAPGFDGAQYELTVSLVRVLLPSFFFLFLVEFATSMLQSFKQFTLPALLRLVAPTVSIISVVALVDKIGIYSLALGVVIGSAVQFGIVAYGLKKQGMNYAPYINLKDPAIVSLLRLLHPFLLSVFMTQGAGIVYRILASTLEEGSLSALKFAEKITQLITIVFLNSVTLVIYPLLSEKASLRDMKGVRSTIGRSMRLVFCTTLPIIVTVAILREPIISLIYQHGSFSAEDAALTSTALLYLVLGLTTTGISSILGHAILALQETRAAVAVTISSQAVAIALFVLLVPNMNVAGLALASSLVPLSSALLYYLYLTRFIPKLHRIFLHSVYIKVMILTSVAVFLVWCIKPFVSGVPVVNILVPSGVGALAYFSLGYVWRIQEMRDISDSIVSRFSKFKKV